MPLTPAQMRRAVALKRAIEWRMGVEACEAKLSVFLREAWPSFDSSPFTSNWHIDAISEHLEAVTSGQIQRLVVNQPPRTGKTNLISIAWPTWTWALAPDGKFPLKGPGVRFLCASYGANKAEADGVTARRLIGSHWYQERWGERVRILRDRDNQGQYDTSAGGSRISTGIPESLGKGGAIRIVDDPSKPDEVESDLQRQNTLRAYDEVWRTRSNDPLHGAEVIVMQRLHEFDLSGHVLAEGGDNVVHLCLPMEYDGRRHCHTVIGFDDPRIVEGELLWPERFDANWARKQKALMGPHSWAGQMQQEPVARGGGIILRDWWKVWPPEGQEDSWTRLVDVEGREVRQMLFPQLDYVLLSVDTAYTQKEENDWSACTVWGSFEDAARNPKIILLEAWRERLEMRALVMKIIETARRRKADGVLIEAKASGLSVIQEMRRLMRDGEFTIFADVPRGDKIARLHAVSVAFSAGLVYAPNRKWADLVIDECASAPRSKWMDLCFVAGTAIVTQRGLLPIEDVVAGDRALTPDGWRDVSAAAMTGYAPVVSRRGLSGTAAHPVFDLSAGGYRPLDTVTSGTRLGTLTLCSLIQTIRLKRLNSRVSSIAAKAASDVTTSGRPANLELAAGMVAARDCTSPFGKAPTAGRFPRAMKSITETLTLLTAALTIWSAYQRISIASSLRTWTQQSARRHWPRPGWLHLSGTSRQKAGRGIERLPPNHWTPLALRKLLPPPRPEAFAYGAVAASPFGAAERRSVASYAGVSRWNTAAEPVGSSTPSLRPVYNLTVADAHCYYANGILVHNCDTVSAGVKKLRDIGVVQHSDEVEADRVEALTFRGQQLTVRQEYGV